MNQNNPNWKSCSNSFQIIYNFHDIMITTLFWIILATGSFFTPNLQNQIIVDTKEGLYMNNLSTITGCNWIRMVVAHNRKKLWKKIPDIQIWDKLTFDWCQYIAKNYTIEKIKWYDKRKLQAKSGRLFLQTCADDSWEWAYMLELQTVKTLKKLTPR